MFSFIHNPSAMIFEFLFTISSLIWGREGVQKMPRKETFSSRFGETRGGRVPQKSKFLGDVFYGWSLIKIYNLFQGLNMITMKQVPNFEVEVFSVQIQTSQ